jgi:translation initiation factor eIF-2B subunit epsilon
MQVQIIGCEVRSLGDAMREIDGKGMLRRDFILMNFDTVTNAKLIPAIMKRHKDNCKRDKDTAMTVVYKRVTPGQRTGNEVIIATSKTTNRLLFHQRIHPSIKEHKLKIPIEIFLENVEVEIHHDLMDPQIAICSTNALPLFSDNFDYDTRDQFIRGLVMNQELQAASIYVEQLTPEQYAAKVSDWNAYHTISQDIINRWVYPLVPDMGVCALKQQYLFLKNNIYRNNNVKVERNCLLKNDVVLQEGCDIGENSVLANCVLGKNCKIGKNCSLKNAYIFDNVNVGSDCTIENAIIGSNVVIHTKSSITTGTVISNDCIIEKNSNLSSLRIQSSIPESDDFSTQEFEKIGDRAYRLKEECEQSEKSIDDDEESHYDMRQPYMKLNPYNPTYESSAYSSKNESDDEDNDDVMPQEDASIFLSEVIESLKRGFEEKSNPDFLILEINSSRYAYNMQLNEVNFYVVKAAFALPVVRQRDDPLDGFLEVYKYLGEKVIKNYIKGDGAMVDCLNAVIECCGEFDKLKPKLVRILHYLYNEDVLSEDVIISWHQDLEDGWVKESLKKFIEWLEQSEEESESD